MLEYIIDHLLEFIAIVAAFVIFLLQIRKKALGYIIVTDTNVVSVSDKVKDKITISFHDEVVPDLRLIEIRIKNTGNLPIKPDDYVQPLVVRHANARALSAEVIDTQSLGVYIETEMSSHSDIVLSKTLLNPKDYFDIKMLMTEGNPSFTVLGRIVGVLKIQKLTYQARNISIDLVLTSLVVVASTVTATYFSLDLTGVLLVGLIAYTMLATLIPERYRNQFSV